MSFLRHLVPVLYPLLAALAPREDAVGRRARHALKNFHQRALDQNGPASLADFDRRLKTIGPGDICLDLGANMGIFTEKLAATGAEVHAYEPDPYCFAALQTRFAGRANVHLHPVAVAHESGMIQLRRTLVFDTDPVAQSRSSSIAIAAPHHDSSNTISVQMHSFEDLVTGFGQKVALVKMDIEGAEFAILDRLLADQKRGKVLPIGALFIETHERHLPDRFALVAYLRRANAAGRLPFPIDTYWP